ncbi:MULTISPECIES: ABC transporter permease [unclassified Aureimonas]|uniref:ABC transporter permease n=1 Tax=unclassified Aureimonas TaxID=2615206 RepID=UPI00070185AF|nr:MULTISPECIES: ABC transporter permease [unclassified Aureimonas]KQT69822.1 spermidine/putrescine ABC transporter permease [Aureimonas sp. Leaf427]KQT76026.1 spermidine/putrescine ABC transporter permease [Aureimonas sp. Leaf460]
MSDLALGTAKTTASTAAPSRIGLHLSPGLRCALPVGLLLAAGFLAPLVTVAAYAFATPRSFDVFRSFTLANFAAIVDPANTVWTSFAGSLLYAGATVAILCVVAYPIAYGLVRVFGRGAGLVSVLFVFPLFVSENVRLHGWVLFFIKNGVLDGALKWLGFSGGPDVLFTPAITLFGMAYVYLPFMLFPMVLGLSMVPRDLIDAARDLGAGRLMIWREIELPLAMPGILIGMLLTFVLAAGAVAEAKVLGGQSVISIAQEIEVAFTYAQNWPLGSALALILVAIVSGLSLFALARLDLDRILGRG